MKKKTPDILSYYDLSKVWCADLFDKRNLLEVITEMKVYISKFLKKKTKTFKVYKKGVLIGNGTIIKQGVVFEGNCIIGRNCIIGPNAYLRENILIGDNVKIGNCVEIKNSIVLNDTFISHLSYVGDSIIGSNVNIAAGTIFANFRLDSKEIILKIKNNKIKTGLKKFGSIIGDGVKIGANTVLNPGTVLEKNCYVYPLKSIKGYYPQETIIK